MYDAETLAGKRILITGGGSGLGLAMTKRFIELGAECFVCGRTEEKLLAAKKEISKEFQSQFNIAVCDVRDYEAVTKLFDEISPLDGLVNNAAGNFYACSEDLTPNGFKTVVDIVLHGTFNCTQLFGKRAIAEKRSGSIVNIVTTYADSGSAYVLPSACAKGGVLTMTKSLAAEWAPYNIRVNAIAPGPIPTKGAWKRLVPSEDIEEKLKKLIPMERFGSPDELANLAVYLLSDLSSYTTGDSISVDGGEGIQGSGFNLLGQLMPREQLRKLFQSMKSKR